MKYFTIALLFSLNFAHGQWVNDPQTNTIIDDAAASHLLPKVSENPDGSYYFSWFGGNGNLDMNLALFDQNGASLWASSMVVSAFPQNTWVDDYNLISDLEGNAIVVFSDVRNGSAKDVAAHKIDAQGNAVWGDNGLSFVFPEADNYSPKATVLSDNNVVITYGMIFGNGNTTQIKAHKIAPNGDLSWGDSGKDFMEANVGWANPAAVSNSDGGFSIGFYKETGSFPGLTRKIALIRCDSAGNALWENEAMVTSAGGISAWDELTLKGDDDGGAYFIWSDDRNNDFSSECYVQYINPEGVAQWTENGAMVSTDTGLNQLYPMLAGTNTNQELLVLWNNLNSSQSAGALVIQKIGVDGTRLFSDTGHEIIPMSDQLQNGISAIQKGDSTYYLYRYFFPGSSFYTTFNALLLNSEGESVWEQPIELNNVQVEKTHALASHFLANQWAVTWSESNNGSSRIMAQNMFRDGSMGPDITGVQNISSKMASIFRNYDVQNQQLIFNAIEPGDQLSLYAINGQMIASYVLTSDKLTVSPPKGLILGTLQRRSKRIDVFKFVSE